MAADAREASTVITGLEEYVGDLTQENLVSTLSAIQDLFAVYAANSVPGSAELRVKYDKPPIETAKTILGHVSLINNVATASPVQQLIAYSSNPLNALSVFLQEFKAISDKAAEEEAKANKDISKAGGIVGNDVVTQAALASLQALYTQIENMEVYTNAVN
jgi:hypothetical protein